MANTAPRLITLIMLLQNRPQQKGADLAAKLGVSIRTLHRYLVMLEEMGIPIYSERGPYGGFSLLRGYKMPPLVFSPEEAVAIYLGTSLVEEMWGQLYQDAARGVLAKLDNLLPDEQRQEVAWARRSLVTVGMHHATLESLAPTLEKLRRAVRERRRISLLYRSSRPEPQRRTVDPYALVHRWGWWYVIGFCHLRQAMRYFRLDRVLEFSLLGETFLMPEDFDVHKFLASAFKDRVGTLTRLRFSPQSKHLALYNYVGWDSAEEKADGSMEVTFFAPDLDWAAGTVLSYGAVVEVLEPPELRRRIVEWCEAISAVHRRS